MDWANGRNTRVSGLGRLGGLSGLADGKVDWRTGGRSRVRNPGRGGLGRGD